MRAIQIAEPRRLQRIDISEPDPPGPGQVLVETRSVGICGTDVSSYLGKFPFFDYPRIPGHELGVEVVAVGEGVESVEEGDHCSVEPYLNCGSCFACRNDSGNCCAELNVIGVMSDGGLCDRFLVPANKLHRSATLTFDQLALVETLAIGCHATSRGNPREKDSVLIIGAGPIGLSALEFVKLSGAMITVMDREKSRLDFCEQHYGIKNLVRAEDAPLVAEAILTFLEGDKYKLVIDATGNSNSMSEAVNYVAPTGTLVYLGVTTESISFPHPSVHRPEMTIKSSRNALPGDFRRCIDLIESGKIDTDRWITHRIDFEEIVETFDALLEPGSGVLKTVITL